jgi:hypothetical protein
MNCVRRAGLSAVMAFAAFGSPGADERLVSPRIVFMRARCGEERHRHRLLQQDRRRARLPDRAIYRGQPSGRASVSALKGLKEDGFARHRTNRRRSPMRT